MKMSEKEFYVDFGSWSVMAENEEEAVKKAEERLSEGDIPPIDSVGEQ